MKTLAVLSALVIVAIAAPAHEEYTDRTDLTPVDFTITQQREKKSPTTDTSTDKLLHTSEDHAVVNTVNQFAPSNTVARTFSGFKKPVIVKKKIGYHVYRDSEEEQAQTDTRESCRKQIKVKLCDDNNSVDKMKSASIDHTHEDISENEMKHSIDLAKEAVETFQRDLQKMEHDSVQHTEERHTKIGADKELRDDIEKARQALEHIQSKFRNMDLVMTNIEHAPNSHLKMVKSDEERMAQWKEVINKHNHFETGRNLEDNFKLTNEHDVSNLINSNKFKANSLNDANEEIQSTAHPENTDVESSSNIRETDIEDGITSVIEDKENKMEIHSDSLKLEKSANGKVHEKEKSDLTNIENIGPKNEMMEKDSDTQHLKHLELKHSSNSNDHENMKIEQHETSEVQQHKEREDEVKDKNFESLKQKTHNLDLHEKHAWNDLDNNGKLKSNVDNTASDAGDQQIKLKNELDHGLVRSTDHDQLTHETKNIATLSGTNIKKTTQSKESESGGVVTENDHKSPNEHVELNMNGHDNVEQRSTLLKKSSTELESSSHSQQQTLKEGNLKDIMQQEDIQRSVQIHDGASIQSKEQNLLTEANLQRSFETDMDKQRTLSKSVSKLDNERSQLKHVVEENHENEKNNNHDMTAQLRATSNFHKELLNTMDFIEDAHQMPLNKLSLTEAGHMKNEKPEHQERFNVPRVQPNSEHLKTMMHLSDNSNHEILQKPQLKMVSMLNNEQPNINVQFNSPQTFEEQTNVQGLMPFKASEDFHEDHLHKSSFEDKLETMHVNGDVPTAFHDPLKIRWAHENSLNSEKLKTAQFHQDHMKMDGSSQHFNIDKSMVGRTNFMNRHLDLSNHINSHQRWAQGNINDHKSVALNPDLMPQNFQTNMQRNDNSQHSLHSHDAFISRNNDHNMMMYAKSDIDSSMQPSSLMHMRGAPKMALDYVNPNQWAHNHGAFRSSYGPGSSSSYGSGGGSASSGSAVGLFPNANVGNCAVPLLVSCSPSVMSGSLAKANAYSSNSYGTNSYSAPSYRSEDINFLTKRGLSIDEAAHGLKVKRHIPLSHKPNIILENKQ